jgi:hypothetical protein
MSRMRAAHFATFVDIYITSSPRFVNLSDGINPSLYVFNTVAILNT